MRCFWVSILSLLVSFTFSGTAVAGTAKGTIRGGDVGGAGPMSVLIITADDVPRAYHKPFSSSGNISMPEIEKLADSGIAFGRSLSTPQCYATRWAILTSLQPANQSTTVAAEDWLPAEYKAAHPQATTFAVGKWGLLAGIGSATDSQIEGYLNAQGFDRYLGGLGAFPEGGYAGGGGTTDFKKGRSPEVQSRTQRCGAAPWVGCSSPENLSGSFATAGTVKDFKIVMTEIRDAGGGPFFGWLSFNTNHFQAASFGDLWPDPNDGNPWDDCGSTDETCAKALVTDSALGLDWAIGEVMNFLTAEEKRNLCIIYHPDNGGEEGFAGIPSNRGKGYAYETSSMTGLLFSGACVPRPVRGGSGTAGTAVIDVAPTIRDLADMPFTNMTTDGTSLSTILTNGCGSSGCDDVSVRTFNFSMNTYAEGAAVDYYVRYEDGSYALHSSPDGTGSELYQPSSDPNEQTDLCGGNSCVSGSGNSMTSAQITACQALVDYANSVDSRITEFTCGQ